MAAAKPQWRKAEIFNGSVWVKIPFDNIRQGDIFRLFNVDGSAVFSPGEKKNTFIAVSNPESVTGPKGNKGLDANPIRWDNKTNSQIF